MRIAICLILLVAGRSIPARAQQPVREFTLDVQPFAATLILASRLRPAIYLGVGVGGGINYLDRTFGPDTEGGTYHNLEQLLHANVFFRFKPADFVDLDFGPRAGIGGVQECTVSDCWPGLYLALQAGAFWGNRRWKVGPRLLLAHVSESNQTETVIHLEFLTARLSFGW
jgi:hypothetical protein